MLTRKYQTRPEYNHDGKVIVMRSNLRWYGDGFEFVYWNGDIIRAAIIVDARDRNVMAWRAVHGSGISWADVCDMMTETVEGKFAALQSPEAIEIFTYNVSACTVKDTQKFVRQLGAKNNASHPSQVCNLTVCRRHLFAPSRVIMSRSIHFPMPKPFSA